ncbi:MAG: type II toxin-antitoxin system VapC family toxin [Pseudomonadales bacterium]|nr:type II toxin-antitoxin system VapC family toxin [Pseudomonadales bacterium]
MIVADTNLISYFLLPTQYSESVDVVYKLDSDWAVPMLWRSEFRNVLALYLRKNIIDLEKALLLQETAESVLSQNEFEVSSSQVLARHLDVPLVTQDKKILKGFPSTAMTVDAFLASRASKS